ncbi:MAG: hypothetical protein ACPL5F_01375 [Moorellaceae bacterium]
MVFLITPGILIVTATLQQALNTFRSNLASLVPDIYGGLSSQQQAEIQQWFSNTQNKLGIFAGYPERPQQLPCIAVTVESMEETEDYEGLALQLAKQAGSSYNLSLGAAFTSTFSCLCLAFNYNFALYLSMFTRWALLWGRQAMSAAGLYNQRISAQEIEPAEIYLNRGGQQEAVFVYQYLVTLRTEHIDTLTADVAAITSVKSEVSTP